MTVTSEIQAFQLDLFVPQGVTFNANSTKLTEWGSAHSISKAARKDGSLRCMVMTYEFGVFEAASKEIITVDVTASEDIELGNQNFYIKNVVTTTKSGVTNKISEIVCPVKIYDEYSISAASSSDVMGAASATPSGTVENGTSVTATATPIAGYEFINWTAGDTEKSTANPYTFTAAEDVALVANFKAKKYSVTFDVDGVPTSSDMNFGSTITAPAAPTKTGYTFTGWEPTFVEGATVPVDGIKYTATWSVNKYTITFDTDGGTTIPAITQDYATAVTAPAAPTKTGYTFAGWDKEIPATIPAEDVTVKAQWTINQYTITFDTDGGTTIPAITQDYATAVTAPAAPTKTGYTFAGWDKEIPATIPAEDVTVKAQWTINQYTITFDTDGGTTIPAITQDYASVVTAPAAPTKTGYTFAGWDKDIPATIPAENISIKAQWTINQYSVKFVSDGEELKSESLDYASVITAPENPVKTGYTFKGWDPAFVEESTVPANDVTYTAVWEVNKYTITFDTDGGTTIPAITQDYASAVTAPAAPTKTGYTFAGWDKDIPATIPAENISIKAQWTINQYSFKFIDDGKVLVEGKLDYGTIIDGTIIPSVSVKEGYTFTGWNPELDATVPAHDMEYTAVYEVNKYKLTYILDGTEVKVIEVEYGAAIEDFVPEVESGKIFDGWTDDIPETMPAHDLVINGKTAVDTFIRQHFAESDSVVPVYTISGTYVTTLTKAEDMKKLTRGTYIINGQKVIVNK